MSLEKYFQDIANYSFALMDRLPIAAAIEPIADTFARLKPALDQSKPRELETLRKLNRPETNASTVNTEPAGMNTIGILADRLTILVCKAWYLEHRQSKLASAKEVRDIQIPDIVKALAASRRGDPSLLEKVSNIKKSLTTASFEEAYYGLLTANILMWETQEMLYVRDMESVAAEELRSYIRFFSEANMMRNAYISDCESIYWHGAH